MHAQELDKISSGQLLCVYKCYIVSLCVYIEYIKSRCDTYDHNGMYEILLGNI